MHEKKRFLLSLIPILLLSGCRFGQTKEVKKVIVQELDRLKSFDTDDTSWMLVTQDSDNAQLDDEIGKVIELYYKDFDYRIRKVSVKDDRADAVVEITGKDAHALSLDFAESLLREEMIRMADSSSENPLSPTEQYALLEELLTSRTYELLKTDINMTLTRTDEAWTLERTPELENALSGGLISDLADSEILSPEETITVYMDTLKIMTTPQLIRYLGADSVISDDDPDSDRIAEALVEQIRSSLDYQILSSETKGYTSVVSVELTTFDSRSILDEYQEKTDVYLSSVDAVTDGAQMRYEQCYGILLNSITHNTATIQTVADISLRNDGVCWTLTDSSEIGDALLGELTTSPIEEAESFE